MKKRNNLAQPSALREEARRILRDRVFDKALDEVRVGDLTLEKLLEELHVYHSELVVQQEALRESHSATELALARFSRLYFDLPLPCLLVSTQGFIKEPNAAAQDLLALDRQLFSHLARQEHVMALEASFHDAQRNGGAECREVYLRGAGRQTLIADLKLIRLPGTDGEQPDFLCSIVDHTELSQQRQALQATADVVAASTTVALRWRWTQNWPLIYASENLKRWGYPAESALSGNITFADLVHPEDKARLTQAFENLAATPGETVTLTYRVIWADGLERWVEAETSLVAGTGTETTFQGLLTDVTERERAHKALRYQLRFQELVADVSSLFVDAQATEIDRVLDVALGRIGRFFGVDRSYLVQIARDGQSVSMTHAWHSHQVPAEVDYFQAAPIALLPWWSRQILERRHVQITDLDALPYEARRERRHLRRRGVRACLTIPLVSHDRTVGGLALEAITVPQAWEEDEVRLLRVVGEAIASMLFRRRAERDLIASESRYRQVTAIMTDVAYSCLRSATGELEIDWITDSIEVLSGFTPSEVLAQGSWGFMVVDEDQESFNANIVRISPGATSTCELRLRHKRGFTRWVRATTEWLPEPDQPGVSRLYGGLVDVTGNKERESEIKRLALVVEQSPSLVLITKLSGAIEYVNARFCEVTGYSPDEVRGEHVHMLRAEGSSASSEAWRISGSGRTWRGELENRKKSGDTYWERAVITPLRDERGQISHVVKLSEDVTDRKVLSEQLSYLIHYDALTGLPNRALLRERIDRALAAARRGSHGIAVISIDLDKLKLINDSLGYAAGDRLLREVSQRLQTLLGESDTLARFGGDNFVFLAGQLDQVHDSVYLVERIQAALDEPVNLAGSTARVTASIGISLFPEDARTTEQLIGHADVALHMAKGEGRRSFRFYTPAINQQILEQFQLEQALRHGLANGELTLHYQPRVELKTGRILSLEALIRWNHPEWGSIPPSRFIPVAESTGLILCLGPFVLEQACDQLLAWRAAGIPIVPVAVNLSANELYQDGLAGRIREIIAAKGIKTDELEFEITESAAMRSIEQAVSILSDLRADGFSLAIDDFGTGYASLSYLNRLPMHAIKIDRSFLAEVGIEGNASDQGETIVKAIIGLGSNLGLHIIAEGVETEAQRSFLLDHGCDVAQGYLFAQPLTADQIAPMLREGSVPILH